MRAEQLLTHTLAGYRLLEILGKGGMGIVYLAQPGENPEHQVAVKILMPPHIATTGEFATFKARFQREALAAHQLDHEHILSVLAYGEEESLCYMVMPLLAGGTLAARLSSAPGGLPFDDVARYLHQLASAIDYAHQHGMVHRDIKPSNVLTDQEGNAYLADFGIVHLFDNGQQEFDQEMTTLTTIGKIYGTPAYMAPERYKGLPAEPATDIYALGVLLYQLVTGRLPFDADNPLALGMKHLNEDPVVPRLLRPDLPEPAEDAMLKALAKEPAYRFASASELADAFESGLKAAWAAGLPPTTEMVAAQLDQATIKRPVATEEMPVEVVQVPSMLSQDPDILSRDLAFAFAPTAVDAPAVVPLQVRPRRRISFVVLGLCGAVFLLCIGLLTFAAARFFNTAAPGPALHPLSTSIASPKTQPAPASSAQSGPAAGSSPVSTHTVVPASTATGVPVSAPTVGSAPTSAPTGVTAPASTPTTAPTPVSPSPTSTPPATATAQGTP